MGKKDGIVFLLILVLATFLGFFKLSLVPSSADWDEAAIGWNAKTIFATKLDEFGTRLPLTFRSFGDYKAPGYIYLTAPLVGFLGLNIFSVRLLSVLAGIGSVWLIFLIARLLFDKGGKYTAIFSALILTVTPWHLLMSRPAFEPNLALFFILGGFWFFLLGLKKNSWWLILSGLLFSLSLYTYHSPKIFVPIFFLGLTALYFKELFQKKNLIAIFVALIFSLALLFPLAKLLLTTEGNARFQGTSIFYSKDGEKRPWNFSLLSDLGKNYFIHFSPMFLFFGNNQSPRVQLRNTGPLLVTQSILLIVGLFILWQKRKKSWAKVLFLWLLAGMVPAAIGFEVPHPIRSFNALPALVMIMALGLENFFLEKDKKKFWGFIVIFFINFSFFVYEYFWQYPIYSAQDWQYGYSQVAKITQKYEDKVDKILLTSHYGQPHIFMVFYQNRDPWQVLWGGMIKYLYRDIKWQEDKNLNNVLIIGTSKEIPDNAHGIVEQIYFPDHTIAFRIVKTDKHE